MRYDDVTDERTYLYRRAADPQAVDPATDGGQCWRRAQLRGPNEPAAWVRWPLPWRRTTAGPQQLLARATDIAGRTQPDSEPYNTGGYLWAVVRHPITVTDS
jgi:hypothetical protein